MVLRRRPLVTVNLTVGRCSPGPWQPAGVDRRPTPSLGEWAVLGVLVERPRHGYDIAAELKAGTTLGDVWRLPRPLVYRALERLDALGLVEPRRSEPGTTGPPRVVFGATRRGRAALRAWLAEPVAHLRDVRSSLLFKLVLLDRLGLDHTPLVRSQREAFAHLLLALDTPPDPADVIATWRHHSAAAVATFIDALEAPAR